MTRIGLMDQESGLARYELGSVNSVMYARVNEPAWIANEPFFLNGYRFKVGSVFQKLGGHRPATTFEMQDGHWLEYAGRIDELLLFLPDGKSEGGWYYAFFSVGERLLSISGHGAYDIW